MFLTVLLAGDENTQGGSAANKESYKTVVSILHSIKSSQDIIDADKTQVCYNSYMWYIYNASCLGTINA